MPPSPTPSSSLGPSAISSQQHLPQKGPKQIMLAFRQGDWGRGAASPTATQA